MYGYTRNPASHLVNVIRHYISQHKTRSVAISYTQLSSSNQGKDYEKLKPMGKNPCIAVLGHVTQSIVSTSLPAGETREKKQRLGAFPVA